METESSTGKSEGSIFWIEVLFFPNDSSLCQVHKSKDKTKKPTNTYTQREGFIIKKRREYTYMGTGEKSHAPRPRNTLRPYIDILNMSVVRQTQTAAERWSCSWAHVENAAGLVSVMDMGETKLLTNKVHGLMTENQIWLSHPQRMYRMEGIEWMDLKLKQNLYHHIEGS